MIKIEVFFTKSNTFWSKFISWYYRLFFGKKTVYTHCGLLLNGNIFEIDISKKSGFHDRILENEYKKLVGYIDEDLYEKLVIKYSNLGYDIEELIILAANDDEKDKDKDFICSTLVAYFLKESELLVNYNYETINPDTLFGFVEKKV